MLVIYDLLDDLHWMRFRMIPLFISWLQYPLYTVMVFDEWGNGLPGAFFVISSTKEKGLELVLGALRSKLRAVNPDWEPAAIIVDNSQAELNVLG